VLLAEYEQSDNMTLIITDQFQFIRSSPALSIYRHHMRFHLPTKLSKSDIQIARHLSIKLSTVLPRKDGHSLPNKQDGVHVDKQHDEFWGESTVMRTKVREYDSISGGAGKGRTFNTRIKLNKNSDFCYAESNANLMLMLVD
jgi:hypothetical protein